MAITLEELVPVLKALRDRAATAAPPTVMAMADTYQNHLTRVTLRRSFVAPGTFGTPAAPGQPACVADWRPGPVGADGGPPVERVHRERHLWLPT